MAEYAAIWSFLEPVLENVSGTQYRSLVRANAGAFTVAVKGTLTVSASNEGYAKVKIYRHDETPTTDPNDYETMDSFCSSGTTFKFQKSCTVTPSSSLLHSRYPLRTTQMFKAAVLYAEAPTMSSPSSWGGPAVQEFYVTDEYSPAAHTGC